MAPTFIRNAKINTAGGVVDSPIYRFSSFAIGDYRIAEMQFVVMDLDNSGSKKNGDGLLGMNFLKVFNFQIDQQNSRLILKPR
jgi:predicted aspartyl protease